MLYALVAVFAACAGYAAGRLHQWYRMDADREEAYQAGYDAAARSTFTMAARMAGRDKSAVRASASVQPVRPAAEAAPVPPPSSGSRSGGSLGPASGSLGPTSPGGLGAAADPESAAGPAEAAAAPQGAGSASGPGEAGGRAPVFGTPFPVPKPPVFPPVPRPAAGVPGGAGNAGSTGVPGSIGVPGGTGASGAAGPAAGAAPGRPVGARPEADTNDAAAADASDGAGPDSGPAAGSVGKRSKPGRATGRLPRRGRHLVPQELVRAATYRLSPDRVARAKVPGALPLPGEEGPEAGGPEPEQPVKPNVPRPRGS